MKKIMAVVLSVCLCVTAFTVNAYMRVTGTYVNTDIVAYIDGMPVKSYNINGWTGIVAEDLEGYGFDVRWDAVERTLNVNKTGKHSGNGNYDIPVNTQPIGSYSGNIYATDIKTYVAGDEVSAFNIGGRTIIYIDELYRFGKVSWFADDRKICYNYAEPWSIDLYETDYEAVTGQNINSFSLNMVKNQEGQYITEGENLDYPDYLKLSYNPKNGMCFSFSLYQRVLLQTEELLTLLNKVSNVRYDGTILSETADLANLHLEFLINGEPATVTKVTQGKGNGHSDFYFWLDCDMERDDVESVSVSFK